MYEYYFWGQGLYNESGSREFFVPGVGLVIDEYTAPAAATNVVMNIV